MFNKLIATLLLFLILLSPLVNAGLGTYEPGQSVRIRFMCLTNAGGTDTGCASANVTILDENNTFYAPTTAPSELSDSVLPGLWNASFTIPAGALNGTWLVRINISNSNTTVASTITSFQVVDNGFNNIQKNFTSITARIAEVSVGAKTNITALNTSITQLNTSITNYDTSFVRGLNTTLISVNNSLQTNINTSISNYDTSFVRGLNTTLISVNNSLQTNLNTSITNYDTSFVRGLNTTLISVNNSLQTNLNLSITNFDTAKIWAQATRTLTAFGDLITDMWSLGTIPRMITTNVTGYNITKPGEQANFSSVSATITDADKADIADKVWNTTRIRNLTNAVTNDGNVLATQTNLTSSTSSLSTGITNNFTASNTTRLAINASIINALNTSISNYDTSFVRGLNTTIISVNNSLQTNLNLSITNQDRALSLTGLNTTLLTVNKTIIDTLNISISNFDNDKDLADNFAGISGGILANVSSLNATIRAINISIIDANNLTSRSIDFVNVWSVATRTLTTFGTLITDIWSLNTINRTITTNTGFNISLPSTQTNITDLRTNIDSDAEVNQQAVSAGILANVTSLNATIRDINTSIINANNLTSRSIDFVNVWSVTTRTLTSFGTLASDVWSQVNRTITTSDNVNVTRPAREENITTSTSALSTGIDNNRTTLRTDINTDRESDLGAVSTGITNNFTATNTSLRSYNASVINALNTSISNIDDTKFWNSVTRTLTGFGTLATDIWSIGTIPRTITSNVTGYNVTKPTEQANITSLNTSITNQDRLTSFASINTTLISVNNSLMTNLNTSLSNIDILTRVTGLNTTLISVNNSLQTNLNASITNIDVGTKVWTYAGGISTFIRDLVNEIWSSTIRRVITDNNAINISLPATQTNITMLNTSITSQERITSLSPINTTLLTVNKTIIDTLNTSITNQDRVSVGAVVNLTGGDRVDIARNVWNFSDLNNPTPGRRIINGVEG